MAVSSSWTCATGKALTQVVFHEDVDPAVHKRAEEVRPEYVVAVEGQVEPRGAAAVNPKMPTGEVEVVASRIWILNESRTPPFPMEEQVDVAEDVRLKYRYVDLRRPRMQRNIILRSKMAFAVREVLNAQGFLEIETPFMTRSTPEGARDYLVPSRVYPGHFYALPQSPQIFKQLLMISGLREVFPDRPLLPRRGFPRGPPGRVYADRSGDVVPPAGADLRSDRTSGAASVRSGRAPGVDTLSRG